MALPFMVNLPHWAFLHLSWSDLLHAAPGLQVNTASVSSYTPWAPLLCNSCGDTPLVTAVGFFVHSLFLRWSLLETGWLRYSFHNSVTVLAYRSTFFPSADFFSLFYMSCWARLNLHEWSTPTRQRFGSLPTLIHHGDDRGDGDVAGEGSHQECDKFERSSYKNAHQQPDLCSK